MKHAMDVTAPEVLTFDVTESVTSAGAAIFEQMSGQFRPQDFMLIKSVWASCIRVPAAGTLYEILPVSFGLVPGAPVSWYNEPDGTTYNSGAGLSQNYELIFFPSAPKMEVNLMLTANVDYSFILQAFGNFVLNDTALINLKLEYQRRPVEI